jgi:hypothetical protein
MPTERALLRKANELRLSMPFLIGLIFTTPRVTNRCARLIKDGGRQSVSNGGILAPRYPLRGHDAGHG